MTPTLPAPLPTGTHLLHVGPHGAGSPSSSMVPDPRLVLVSDEARGGVDDEGARRVVAEVGGPRPHVLAVAWRHDRVLPSLWRQRVTGSGLPLDYGSWLRLVLGPRRPDDAEWRAVWQTHDTAALVRRWAAAAGTDEGPRLTVVVPDDEGTLVVRTVGALLGLPGSPATSDAVGDGSDVVEDESLAWPTVELLRRVHRMVERRGWSDEARETLVGEGLVRTLTRSPAVRAAGGRPVPPPPRWAAERLVELGEERVSALRAAVDDGLVRVVGDLDDLRVPAPGRDLPDALPDPGEVPIEAVVTAVAALASLTAEAEKALGDDDPEERERLSRVGRRVSRRTVRRARRQGPGHE